MQQEPLVSIVIPTLNSEKTLGICLESIANQIYKNIEIIVVDGGSKDKTVEIAKKYEANVIETNIKNVSIQTNIGMINSDGIYVYRVDSDVILSPQMVKVCVKKCELENYNGCCIFWIPDDSISFWAKVRKIEKENFIKYPNYVGSIKYDKNVLGARFLKKEVLIEVGMLDEDVTTLGEDYALYNKLAESDYEFAIINLKEKHIGEPKTLVDVFKKNYNYGLQMKDFLNQTGSNKGLKQFLPFGRKYMINMFTDAFSKDIKLSMGLILYISIVYTSTGIGMLNRIIQGKNEK